ncbi:MAG: transketolase family protein [Defluviitaleaceae bacterium]|nr:transketolase family protein [Defluviitaleaceae bacterium]
MAIIYDGTPEKRVYKNIFGETMEAIAASDADVVYLDADVMNSAGTLGFWKRNPRQAINCGIAEANMLGVAAGLSAGGKKPCVHTFGIFATRRCYDQAFISAAYAGNSVRIFGSDPGVVAAFNGGTHMPFEDMALMRAIPDSTVMEISDGAMLTSLMWQVKERQGLTYVRWGRKSYPALYSDDHEFVIGRGQVLRDGSSAAVIACGLMVGEAMAAAALLENEGINLRVVDMFTIKPIDREIVIESARKTGAVVVAENHNTIGGLGDAVADALLEAGVPVKFRKVGVSNRFGSVGPQPYLQEHYGLTAANIVEAVRAII